MIFIKKHQSLLLFILISFLLIFSSFHFYYIKWLGYESIPDTDIFDERDYPFVGYTFRKTGIPTGWSTMDVYKSLDQLDNKDVSFNGLSITVDNQNPNLKNTALFNYPVTYVTDVNIGKGTETIRLVQPFFDHPIFGSYLYSLGINSHVSTFDSIKPSEYRQVALYLSLATGILIFIYSFLLYQNLFISFLSFVIYSTVPTYVLMSRFALLENILVPLSLIIFSLVILFIRNKSKKSANLLLFIAGLLAALAFLTKESAIYVVMVVILYLFNSKISYKKYLYFLCPFLFLTAIYYLYMYLLAPNLFFKLLFDQANRAFYGPLSFLSSMIGPNFKNFPKEGYWIFGLVSIFSLCYQNIKKHFYLLTAFLSYLFIFLFLGGLNYPWYSLPFLPFLVISSAFFLNNLFTSPQPLSLAIFYLLPFSSSFYWGYFTYHLNSSNYSLYRLSLIFFVLLFIVQKYLYIKLSGKKYALGKLLWFIVLFLLFIQIKQWNLQAFQYIIANWGKLPEIFTILDKIL